MHVQQKQSRKYSSYRDIRRNHGAHTWQRCEIEQRIGPAAHCGVEAEISRVQGGQCGKGKSRVREEELYFDIEEQLR